MNDTARRIMRDRLMRREDGRGYDGRRDYGHEHGGGEYRGSLEYRGDYRGDYRRDRRDYGEDYMDRRDRNDYRRDYGEDYRRDRRDRRRDYDEDDGGGYRRNSMGRFTDRAGSEDMSGHEEEEVYLKKEDAERWVKRLENEDGTRGAHFEKNKVKEAMKNMSSGKFSEDDMYVTVNMLYSDYCAILHPYISHEPEKELQFYAKMARAFLEDKDGPEPSEKLALYYYCIVEGGE